MRLKFKYAINNNEMEAKFWSYCRFERYGFEGWIIFVQNYRIIFLWHEYDKNYDVFFNLQSCFIMILSRWWWSYLFWNEAVLNWSDHIIIDDINWILISSPTQYWVVHNRVMYVKISIKMSIWRNIKKTLMWNQILEKN